MEGVGSGNYRGPSKSVSRPRHYWHSELDNALLGGGGGRNPGQCTVLAAFLTSTHEMPLVPLSLPWSWLPKRSPDIAICPLGEQLRSTALNEQTKAKAVNKLVQQCQLESSGQTGRRNRWLLSPKHANLTTTSAYFHGNSSESLIYSPKVPNLFLGLVSSENTSTRTELSI